jgi:uncharacterized SAM-binding protein YcdF (DUF218 family)
MNTDAAAKIIWDYMHMHQPLEKADSIFVLGSSDLRVATYAAQLYLDGWAPLLILSGGEGRSTLNLWDMTEAEKFASIALELGVPEDNILLEKRATNTGENIQFTKQLLAEKGIDVSKLILVQKPYMERRTYATFMKQWPEMSFIVMSPDISYEEYPEGDRTKEHVLNMMVGDLQRIKEYPAKGFQIEQDIPENVWSAYEQLVQEGYMQHLIK